MEVEFEFCDVDAEVKDRILNFCNEFESKKEEFIISTSGSTGTPKEIIIKREQMISSTLMTQKSIGLKEGYRCLICLNTDYIAGKMMLVRCMVLGMKAIIVMPSSDPLKKLAPEITFDFGAFVPYQMHQMLSGPDKEQRINILNKFQSILLGGDMINFELDHLLQSIHSPIYHTFGMTETVSHFALRKINGETKSSYYKILPGVDIKTDVKNRLRVRSSVTNNEWLSTNDIVEIILPESNVLSIIKPIGFYWKGRFDNVINSGGIKIQIEEVEAAIEKVFYKLKIPNRFFAAGIKDLFLNQKLTLFVESDKPFEAKRERNIFAEMDKLLMKYQVPKGLVYLEKFKETNTGKVIRNASVALAFENNNF